MKPNPALDAAASTKMKAITTKLDKRALRKKGKLIKYVETSKSGAVSEVTSQANDAVPFSDNLTLRKEESKTSNTTSIP